ncbi:MAG: hypothetical protein HYV63_30160 [Candidatus Schekmanbacteria bacterium]|nr:hypothetical protein [Candidatus Schekmanbacteria bacterium]
MKRPAANSAPAYVALAVFLCLAGLLYLRESADPCSRRFPPSGDLEAARSRLPQSLAIERQAERVAQEGGIYQVWLLAYQRGWRSCHSHMLTWDGKAHAATVLYSTSCEHPETEYRLWQIPADHFDLLFHDGRHETAQLPVNMSLQSEVGTLYLVVFAEPGKRTQTAVHSVYICPDHPDFESYRRLLSMISNTIEPGAIL